MSDEIISPARRIAEVMGRMYARSLTTSTGGNLSMRDEQGRIWITPGGTDKGRMTEDEIICQMPDGSVLSGGRPSVENHFHRGIYRVREDINAIIHAHSIGLISFSRMRSFPFTDIVRCSHLQEVKPGCASCYPPGSGPLTEEVVSEFERGCNVVLIDNHGVIIGTDTLEHGLSILEELELTAEIQLDVLTLLNGIPEKIILHGSEEAGSFGYHPAAELSQIQGVQMCDFLARGYQKALYPSSCGRISIPAEGGIVINSPQTDRCAPKLEDFRFVPWNEQADEETEFHKRAYLANRDTACVITAVPAAAMALGAVDLEYDINGDVESLLGLRFVKKCDSMPDVDAMRGTAVFIMDCRFAAACGTSLFEAFDKMEILGNGARYLLNRCRTGIAYAPIEEKCRDMMTGAGSV